MREPAVYIKNVVKSFKAGVPVLKGISLSVNEGEMVGLIGASGSGKSTLIRLIAGFERIDRNDGEIRLYGTQTQIEGRHRPEVQSLRKDIGIIFQQFNLVGRLTLLSNVLVGRLGRVSWLRGTLGLFPQEDRIKALRSLERVGIVDKAYQRASTLSGGQQQRAAIARALTQEAKLILADEPIASLDPASAENVMTTLREINRQDGVTVLVSLHQIDHAFKHCDRIVALKDGVILHDGGVDSITKEDIQDLYGVGAFEDDQSEEDQFNPQIGQAPGAPANMAAGNRQESRSAAASRVDA